MGCCSLYVLLALANVAAPPSAYKFIDLLHRLEAAQHNSIHGNVAFQVTEPEVNEYVRYALAARPRPGIESVTIKLFPHNYISSFAVVDFDAVERRRPGTIPAVLKPVLNGKNSIWVDYRFYTQDGKASFSVEKAYYGKVRIPAFVVEKMIATLAARRSHPYDTTKPVPLPLGLRNVWTNGKVIEGRN